jgi:hypothetical protein
MHSAIESGAANEGNTLTGYQQQYRYTGAADTFDKNATNPIQLHCQGGDLGSAGDGPAPRNVSNLGSEHQC